MRKRNVTYDPLLYICNIIFYLLRAVYRIYVYTALIVKKRIALPAVTWLFPKEDESYFWSRQSRQLISLPDGYLVYARNISQLKLRVILRIGCVTKLSPEYWKPRNLSIVLIKPI